MARPYTKADLITYIRNTLGEPLIRVEVSDTQIENIIDNAIQKFTEYAYGDLEDVIVLQINGAGKYDLPELITNIVRVTKGSSSITNFNSNFGAGFVPNIWSEQYFTGSLTSNIMGSIMSVSTNRAMLEKFFGDEIAHNFNYNRHELNVLEGYVGPLVVHYQYEYVAEPTDKIFNHEWIKEYTVEKTRYQWGNNTGKVEQTIIGGARINYADMKNEAIQRLQELHEELITKWSDPAPISIG